MADKPRYYITTSIAYPNGPPHIGYGYEVITTTSWSIGAGVTLSKTGPGAVAIDGPHGNGAGAVLAVNGGSVTFNSDAGPSGPARFARIGRLDQDYDYWEGEP